jgi:hypothetical protein
MAKQKSPESSSEPGSHPVFALLSLLIFIHLFCIFTSLSANVTASLLQARLLAVLRPYVQLLNFDLNFKPYHLTHATSLDVDHQLEILPEGKNPDEPGDWLVIPSGGLRGGEPYKRQQRLARLMAIFAEQENDNFAAIVAEDIGRYFLARDVRATQVRVRRHLLQTWDAASGRGTPEQRNPDDPAYFQTAYAANVLIDSADNVLITKIAGRRETARPTGPSTEEPAP